jgi:hypothetical protein
LLYSIPIAAPGFGGNRKILAVPAFSDIREGVPGQSNGAPTPPSALEELFNSDGGGRNLPNVFLERRLHTSAPLPAGCAQARPIFILFVDG